MTCITVAQLRDTLAAVTAADTDDPGDHQPRIPESRDVLVRHDGRLMPVGATAITFVGDRFALILDADQ